VADVLEAREKKEVHGFGFLNGSAVSMTKNGSRDWRKKEKEFWEKPIKTLKSNNFSYFCFNRSMPEHS
jgi:hypothetical protein